jgi:hypothetical protein
MTDSTTQDSTQNAALIMPYTQMCSRKMLGFSLSDYVHSPRAQALPSNFSLLTTRGSDHSSQLTLFLSFFRDSCSNKLNHTLDAAEDHDHGYKLLATELLNLFFSFCPTLLALSQHRLPTTQTNSFTPHRERIPLLLSYNLNLYTKPHKRWHSIFRRHLCHLLRRPPRHIISFFFFKNFQKTCHMLCHAIPSGCLRPIFL